MGRHAFDDEWFLGWRHRLLDGPPSRSGRWRHTAHNLMSGSRLAGVPDSITRRAIGRLAGRHAAAVLAYMQFYRACLEAVGPSLPSDDLVNTAVQIEWLWYSTPFKSFYRDHLAHVLKVTALGRFLLADRRSPLAVNRRPLVGAVSRDLARRQCGSGALRAAARRCGNHESELGDPTFWREAILEALRVAALLHDVAYPAVMADKVGSVAAPVRPCVPSRSRLDADLRDGVSLLSHRLVAAPFCEGQLPGADGIQENGRSAFEEVFRTSHSLQAGYAITRFAEEANRVFQLNPFDAFVLEWAALAASVHDYNRLHDEDPDRPRHLDRWLKKPANRAAIRPRFADDPVSYTLALADQLQDFGRLHYEWRSSPHAATLEVRYPCRAVVLETSGRPGALEATVTFQMGTSGPSCFCATEEEIEQIRTFKQRDGRSIFGPDGWLDHEGLFRHVRVRVRP